MEIPLLYSGLVEYSIAKEDAGDRDCQARLSICLRQYVSHTNMLLGLGNIAEQSFNSLIERASATRTKAPS
jgi:hypothetical protein